MARTASTPARRRHEQARAGDAHGAHGAHGAPQAKRLPAPVKGESASKRPCPPTPREQELFALDVRGGTPAQSRCPLTLRYRLRGLEKEGTLAAFEEALSPALEFEAVS